MNRVVVIGRPGQTNNISGASDASPSCRNVSDRILHRKAKLEPVGWFSPVT